METYLEANAQEKTDEDFDKLKFQIEGLTERYEVLKKIFSDNSAEVIINNFRF